MWNKNRLLKICMADRNMIQRQSWTKKFHIDLILKHYILLMNSVGKKNILDNQEYFFVDEIKNVSMINNLRKTMSAFKEKGKRTYLLCFYKADGLPHVKSGYVLSIFLILKYTLSLLWSLSFGLLKKRNIEEQILYTVLTAYLDYLKQFTDANARFYLMSDHHFFSTLTALSVTGKSLVLQHGLILDKRFYYPIRADYFLAWGARSKKLLNNDPQIMVTGTYKFNFTGSLKTERIYDIWMFCISSLDNEIVKRKIDCLLNLIIGTNIQLIVKCHPGSMFDINYWKKIYRNKNIVFYQNELLEALDFDLAISENSTIIMDLLVLGKPFILFDQMDGYFAEYSDLIPHGNTEEEIRYCLKNLPSFDFEYIRFVLYGQELNGGKCIITDENL